MNTSHTTLSMTLNECPKPLHRAGQRAYEIVSRVLREHGATYTGGCTTFYSPKSWKERREKYGLESVLIVVYDGGDVSRAFRMDDEDYALWETMAAALEAGGLYAEECTSWYSAIYER